MKLAYRSNDSLADASCQSFCNIPSAWILQGTGICYGAKDNDYGNFTFQQNCQLVALRLRHVSGKITCAKREAADHYSRWGCQNFRRDIKTFVVEPRNNQLWYPEKYTASLVYWLDGFMPDDDVLILKKKANFTAGNQLQIWYSEDWIGGKGEEDNEGRHCIEVDVSCLI